MVRRALRSPPRGRTPRPFVRRSPDPPAGGRSKPSITRTAAARDVDRARRAGLVHRHVACRSAGSGAVAERRSSACPSRCRVLDGVVGPVCRSPWPAAQVHTSVPSQQVQHVVEETDPRGALAPRPSPSSSRVRSDLGLAGLTLDLGSTGHGEPSTVANACLQRLGVQLKALRPRDRGRRPAPAPAPPSPIRTSVKRRRKWTGDSAEAKRAAPLVGRMWFEPAM